MQSFNRYKEIWFGVLLGASAWILDAAMHAELGETVHSHGFAAEIFAPHPTAFIFRGFYFVIAVSFGVVLWRANWRERQLKALEESVMRFQRQLDSSAMRILIHVRQLQNRNAVKLDESSAALASEIGADARLIDELTKKYMRFGEQVQAGETAAAIETSHMMENWGGVNGKSSLKS